MADRRVSVGRISFYKHFIEQKRRRAEVEDFLSFGLGFGRYVIATVGRVVYTPNYQHK